MEKDTFKKKLTNLTSNFITENLVNTEGTIIEGNKQKPTTKQGYLIDAFSALIEIETIIEQLEQTPHFLSNFRQTQKLKENGIRRFNHIIYHIESYLFRTTGIVDRMMILLNIIFETNLPPEKCKTYNFLLDNKQKEGKYAGVIKERSSELFLELNSLALFIQKFREIRNEITHQKRFNSNHIRNIELFNIVEFDVETSNYKHFAKREADKKVSMYKKKMLDTNNKIKAHIDKIYELLDFIWVETYDKK